MSTSPTPAGGADQTQPVVSSTPTQPIPTPEARRSLWRRARWFLLLIPIAALLAAAGGYQAGVQQREVALRQALAELASAQFDLGLQDLEAGHYDLARQRFEYVIRLDPTYPGAYDRLVEVLVLIGGPITTPVPFAIPSPNLAPVEELFSQAQAAFAAEDWTTVIDTLLAMRAKDPAYRSVEADGMMFAALRNRGLYLIRYEWQLEPGLYDLSLAERFGPLDNEAEEWRNSARFYLLANSYLGLDWGMATDLFFQVCVPAANWDSCDRLGLAAQRYAEQLRAISDPCELVRAYLEWEWSPDYPVLQPIYDVVARANEACAIQSAPPPTETSTPTPEVTPAEAPPL